ncbi:MAG: nicotinate-nucleotide adenylyltransferase [Candidatus Electrothrix aestuarii]|uniref:Nicotinate-nucleotide adenylyltransferase n=1 Tax=Candidatus Electrothrix aestuarii TaxID=3062594 RepID=A0AAU8LY71_9BACT|nr:nicotinate-nucleotide adenylyltransferase [Candidatus Electrothrix aestuarii]
MFPTGVIHGRFQILHNDHLKYLLAGKARCEHLVVGITNPDPCQTKDDAADPKRSSDQANPFTYFQRYQMIRAALTRSGLEDKEFSVVPFPINFPERYRYYVPLDATFFLTIYDDWGERKLEVFQALGLRTEVLWRRTPATKGLSATDIRAKMREGEPWQHLVPPGVAEIITGAQK